MAAMVKALRSVRNSSTSKLQIMQMGTLTMTGSDCWSCGTHLDMGSDELDINALAQALVIKVFSATSWKKQASS